MSDVATNESQQMTTADRVGIVAMFLGTFTVGIDSFVLSPLLTTMAASFHAGTDQIALGVTAYALACAIGAPLLAPLGDRFRPQVVAAIGILVFAVATVALTIQTTLPGLYLFRVLAGLGGAMWMPNVQAYVTRRWPRPLSTKLIGIVVAGLSAAIALGVPVGALLAGALSWQQTFLGIAALAVLSAIVLFAGLGGERSVGAVATRHLGDYAHTLSEPAVRWALSATLAWMTGFYGVYTFLGTFLQNRLGIGVAASGGFLIAYGVGNFVASTTSGWVNTRLGAPHRPIVLFGVSSSLFVLGLTGVPLVPWLAVLLLLGWAVSQGFAATGLITLAAAHGGGHVATVLALNSSFIYVGAALGSALFGLFHGPASVALGLPSIALTLAAGAFAVRASRS